jgi:hypothetical protein
MSETFTITRAWKVGQWRYHNAGHDYWRRTLAD